MMLKIVTFLLVCMLPITTSAERTDQDPDEYEVIRKYAESGAPKPAGWQEIRKSAELGSTFVMRKYPLIIDKCKENNESISLTISELFEQYPSKHNEIITAGKQLLISGNEDSSAVDINARLDRSLEPLNSKFNTSETNSTKLCNKFKSNLKRQLKLADLAML